MNALIGSALLCNIFSEVFSVWPVGATIDGASYAEERVWGGACQPHQLWWGCAHL